MKPLLSCADAAELLGIQPNTLRRLIEHGRLPAYRVGRLVKLRPEDLDEYVRRNRM
ncbi:MAG: helix-turn-helix domain-containing protein [Acidimicrobiales bacterium]